MTWFRVILFAIVGLWAGLTAYRLFVGLGPPTNLTDHWPWALWTWWKLTGVALAGAGYSTMFVVHFVGRERWKDVERGAFLTSLLGYLMVCAALILDLGQWYNAWHPVVYWGYHSVMFELFWCIGGYTVVQLAEFVYVFEERVRMPRLRKVLNPIYGPLLFLGAILPVFHQSALCSLYVIAKGRLDPLWWSQLLPLFAVLTSFYVGPSVVAVENLLSARVYPRRIDRGILGDMVRVSAWIMAVYLALRIADYAVRGMLGTLVDGSALSNVALIELLLGVALPMVMFLTPRVRASTAGLVTGSALAIGGVVLNRFNIVLLGMAASTGEGFYRPYWIEVVFILGLAALAMLAYLVVVENFAVLPLEERTLGAQTPPAQAPPAEAHPGAPAPAGRVAVGARSRR
jgi:Ni/Fe-hydrogenase subunit HybB-like protein